jgi:hypothetical protein
MAIQSSCSSQHGADWHIVRGAEPLQNGFEREIAFRDDTELTLVEPTDT